VVCMEDRDRARDIVTRYGRGYLYSLVCLYHDTIPVPSGAPVWPEPPSQLGPEMVDWAIEAGYLLCGTPEEVSEQIARGHQTVGVDQLVFGVPGGSASHEETLEILETFGKQVIPEFDEDPVHSTTRYRESAVPKHPTFNAPPPEIKTIWSEGAPTVAS
jgi:alkanesulfonate monooxygenase SsuD/methylene tetrahydromethanopterin reductase-like flavin-dependent oxidoreductase (luciferase family)